MIRVKAARLTAIAVLSGSGCLARHHAVSPPEERVFRPINQAPDAIHAPVWVVMQWGSLAGVHLTAAALFKRSDPRRALTVALAGTTVWAAVKLVKPLIGRGRPEHLLDAVNVRGSPQTGLGYPSGHAAVATTLAVAATDAGPVRRAALAAAFATGLARMYSGAHLPLDVAGGFAIGALAGPAARAIQVTFAAS